LTSRKRKDELQVIRKSGYREIRMLTKAIRLVVLSACGLLAGCEAGEFFKPEGPPSNSQIYAIYRQTALKQSTSAGVIAAFGQPKYALLSQSKSVIALAGKKKEGYKTWFNMVAFDEDELTARRKYVFICDERPKQLGVEPWEGIDFDCKMVLPRKVLDEPYANENARRVAILKEVGADVRKDTGEVGMDNKSLKVCGMIISLGIDTVVTELDSSPALATRFTDPKGLEFEHVNFDKGLMWMTVKDDMATVKMRLGSFAKKGKISFEGEVLGD
jgi:hypothetical protein